MAAWGWPVLIIGSLVFIILIGALIPKGESKPESPEEARRRKEIEERQQLRIESRMRGPRF